MVRDGPALPGLLRKAGAAFETPAMQDRASCLRGHALQEAVLGCAMALFGVVGAFWHIVIVP